MLENKSAPRKENAREIKRKREKAITRESRIQNKKMKASEGCERKIKKERVRTKGKQKKEKARKNQTYSVSSFSKKSSPSHAS